MRFDPDQLENLVGTALAKWELQKKIEYLEEEARYYSLQENLARNSRDKYENVDGPAVYWHEFHGRAMAWNRAGLRVNDALSNARAALAYVESLESSD